MTRKINGKARRLEKRKQNVTVSLKRKRKEGRRGGSGGAEGDTAFECLCQIPAGVR